LTSKTKLIDHQQVAAIQQINLGYNAEQDRLLFRVGLSDNTELLVWLTSRITQLLWSLLTGEVHLPTADFIQAEMPLQQSVEQFKLDMLAADVLKKMDFKTEYQPRPEVRNDGAMLALNAVLIHVENKQPSLELPCLEGVTVRINLNPDLTLAMCNMLQLATKEAGWVINASIAAPVQSPIAIQMDQKKVLH
jgi:hypothetical protein